MSGVTLRQVRIEDLELMMAWRSNPRIYEHFREQEGPLEWAEHIQWFATRPPERRDFVIEYQGRRVGVVAIAADGDVGTYIGEESLWGEGIATEALKIACDRMEDRNLQAQIHTDNERSRRLFEKCGFEQVTTKGVWVILERPCES
jgi:RimJ/RimL family protein N-acetyltransferase